MTVLVIVLKLNNPCVLCLISCVIYGVEFKNAIPCTGCPGPRPSPRPASCTVSGSSRLREAPGKHMLSQLGLPASNRDTLTLIHSTGEVLSLARRRESTNTETFTLRYDYTNPPTLPLPVSHLSLFPCSSLLCWFVSLLLSKRGSPSSIVLVSVTSVAVYFSICVSSPPPPSLSYPVNISLCSSATLILSLLFIPIWCLQTLLLGKLC